MGESGGEERAAADRLADCVFSRVAPARKIALNGFINRSIQPERAVMSYDVKYLLPEDRIPKAWYNIAADLPKPLPPPLHPGTGQPIGPADLVGRSFRWR